MRSLPHSPTLFSDSAATQTRCRHMLVRLVLCLAVVLAALTIAGAALAQESGYTYTVQPGDNWTIVARRVGLTVEELQAANPQAVRPSGYLIIGEELTIPTGPTGEQYYEVQAGEGWSIIAEKFDVNVRLLQAVNPRLVRPGEVLYVGDRLLIPGQTAQGVAATPTPFATGGAVAAATSTPTPVPTATATPTAEPEAPAEAPAAAETQVEEADGTAAITEAPEEASLLPQCPEEFEAYPDLMVQVLNAADDDALLDELLVTCGLDQSTETIQRDLTGDGIDDLVLTYQRQPDPSRRSVFRQGELIIVNGTGDADTPYELAFTAFAAGSVDLLAAEDLNADGQTDVVWIDTTCGASTCFDTVYVRSWDGEEWQDWTEGTVTMAQADVEIADVDETGAGSELQLTGGEYGSFGAGPQRQRTEIWGSVDGQPYELLQEAFGPSDCLYHTIVDANRAFAEDLDFAGAQTLYEEAIANDDLMACWVRTDELDELRSFALFRLALLSGYQGDAESARATVEQLEETYPDQVYAGVARQWLDVYLATGDLKSACRDVNQTAAEDGAAVEILADYGYANPTFTVEDVCPLLDVDVPSIEPLVGEETEVARETAELEEAEESDELEEAEESESAATRQQPTATGESDEATMAALTADLPECPEALSGYGETFAEVLSISDDPLVLETWLRLCNAMTDERGAILFYDLNGDDADDVLAFPTIVSDTGYGPGGADGTLMVFHAQESGTYTNVLSADAYGQPAPLAVGDVNEDGVPELLWKVESCATFCVVSVQSITWDEETGTYVAGILPGATIAEGDVYIEDVNEDDPGSGRQLRLVGGVSGTPGGGLAVPHEEIWQSVDGEPFQRIAWVYDREAEQNDCLGLRLIEADVALQAANVLGYEPAIERYQAALDDADLQACSLFGIEPEDELNLLRGLASFRLIQAQALSGDVDAAQATLADLTESQPDGDYTEAATLWLESYQAEQDPAAACEAVVDVFTDNAALWQVTDQFGYDHPALAAEQICYLPNAE